MGYMSYYGFKNGNIVKLRAPLDRVNNFCGSTEHLKDYPNLYLDFKLISIDEIFKSTVCVKECP